MIELPVTFPAGRRKRLILLVVSLALVAIVAVFLFFFLGPEAQKLRFNSADRGFATVTGMNLPANLHAISHASEMSDNLFHTTHYWFVQGPIESLRKLAPSPNFERSDEDAGYELKSIGSLMTLGAEAKLLEGYEGNYGGGRDRWLMILEPGDRAIYAW